MRFLLAAVLLLAPCAHAQDIPEPRTDVVKLRQEARADVAIRKTLSDKSRTMDSRLRAIEARRFLIRAANDGVSAVIGPRGEIVARAAEYERVVLRSAATVPLAWRG